MPSMSISVCTIYVCDMCMLSVHAYRCAYVSVQVCTCAGTCVCKYVHVYAKECCMYMLRVCDLRCMIDSPHPLSQFLFPMCYIQYYGCECVFCPLVRLLFLFFVVVVVGVFFACSFCCLLLICGYSLLMYGVNECNVRDECMFL